MAKSLTTVIKERFLYDVDNAVTRSALHEIDNKIYDEVFQNVRFEGTGFMSTFNVLEDKNKNARCFDHW